jgi:hypothetical protein
MCSTITRLNFRNNLIREEENFSFLESLTYLKWLNLNENPIKANKRYPELIEEYLPNLRYLDIDEELYVDRKDENNCDESNISLGIPTDRGNSTIKNFNQSVSTFSSSPSLFNNTKKVINKMTESSVEFNSLSGCNFFRSCRENDLIVDNLLINERIQSPGNCTDNSVISDNNNSNNIHETSLKERLNSAKGVIQGMKAILNTNIKEKNENGITLNKKETTIPDSNNLTPSGFPSNSNFRYNFSFNNREKYENHKNTSRGKSQNNRICNTKNNQNNILNHKDNHDSYNNSSNFLNKQIVDDVSTNPNINLISSQRLRPLILKKEAKNEIYSFRQSTETSASEKLDFINKINRNKPLNPLKLSKIGNLKNKSQAVALKVIYRQIYKCFNLNRAIILSINLQI